jgi:hydrogenase expression/formation protein HypC
MCLAVPMQITRIGDNGAGTVELEGARYEVNLSLVENPAIGEFVIVHAGYAIEKLDRREADERIALFEDLAEIYRQKLGGEVRLAAPPKSEGVRK